MNVRWAKAQGLWGVAMWTADSVDYSDPNGGAAELWSTLKFVTQHPKRETRVLIDQTSLASHRKLDLFFTLITSTPPYVL